MDPNILLLEMLRLADDILATDGTFEVDVDDMQARDKDAVELAQRVRDLDQWLRKGGFLPRAWQPKK
jgi:hypothetical protein